MYKLGLIGFPVKHSLSPWIHGEFLENTEIKGEYTLIEIDPEKEFETEINKLKEQQIKGFNVTVPYKQKIISYLDELDEEARKIGAVNTVVSKNGKWIGYNTDGKGYVRSLQSQYPRLFDEKEKRILIIGAGGAARGIYYALVMAGFMSVDIANRTARSADDIVKLNNQLTNTDVITLNDAQKSIHKYDVIIQTTSVGMNPNSESAIIDLEGIKKNCIVSDIVYQPIMTAFLKQAQERGALIHFGHTMLLYQAQYAFEIWTNKQASINNMENELKSILEGR